MSSRKDKTTAALLALFGGVFGLHKFYLRKPQEGIFFIFLTIISTRFSFSISGILGIIDAVRLFMMKEEDFDRQYNSNKEWDQARRRDRKRREQNTRRRTFRTENTRDRSTTRTRATERR